MGNKKTRNLEEPITKKGLKQENCRVELTNDMAAPDCRGVQVVLCEREHGGGGRQEHLQAAGQGRGLAPHMICLSNLSFLYTIKIKI